MRRALFAAENADASRTKDDDEDEFKTSEFALKQTLRVMSGNAGAFAYADDPRPPNKQLRNCDRRVSPLSSVPNVVPKVPREL